MDKNFISIYLDYLEIYKIAISYEEFISFHNPLYLQIYNSKRFIFNPDLLISHEMIIDYIKIYKFDITQKINLKKRKILQIILGKKYHQ